MSEETKPIEQDYHYQVDQQVSVNAFLDIDILGETVRFQVTNRYGATPEKIIKTVKAEIEAYAALRQEFPRAIVQPQPQKPTEPTYQPIDDGGNDLPDVKSFTAEKLVVDMHDSKFSFKVTGGQFTQFGVTVYDEVLKAAGLKFDPSNAATVPNINGWRADWIEYPAKNGKMYKKVTRLVPGKAPF